MGEPQLKDWLFIEEFADVVRLPVSTVYKRISEGAVKASKPGKRILIHKSEVEKLMKRYQVTA